MNSGKQRKVVMHVGLDVLKRVPYFGPQISGELSGSCLQLRLPQQCSMEALTLLLRRLYFSEAPWNNACFELTVQMAQLAEMLLIEDIHDELLGLVRRSMKSQAN